MKPATKLEQDESPRQQKALGGTPKSTSKPFLAMALALAVGALSLTACSSNNSTSPNSNVNPVQAAKTRISLGLTYLQNGNFTQAKTNLDKAMQFAPGLMDSHFAMAYYFQSVDEVSQAERSYQQALQLAPGNADLLNSYGAFLCLQGRFQQAEEYLKAAINTQQYSYAASTYENLAICSQAQANIDEAIQYLKTALSHEPGRIKSAWLLLELTTSTGRWTEAKSALSRFEKIAPVNARSLEYTIMIERGLGNHANAQGYAKKLRELYPDYQPSENFYQYTETKPAAAPITELAKKTMSDRIHVVQRGENLYRISLKYNVRMQHLIEWNRIQDSAQVRAGTKLIISDPNAIERDM